MAFAQETERDQAEQPEVNFSLSLVKIKSPD
jgi:hypothetical protein